MGKCFDKVIVKNIWTSINYATRSAVMLGLARQAAQAAVILVTLLWTPDPTMRNILEVENEAITIVDCHHSPHHYHNWSSYPSLPLFWSIAPYMFLKQTWWRKSYEQCCLINILFPCHLRRDVPADELCPNALIAKINAPTLHRFLNTPALQFSAWSTIESLFFALAGYLFKDRASTTSYTLHCNCEHLAHMAWQLGAVLCIIFPTAGRHCFDHIDFSTPCLHSVLSVTCSSNLSKRLLLLKAWNIAWHT